MNPETETVAALVLVDTAAREAALQLCEDVLRHRLADPMGHLDHDHEVAMVKAFAGLTYAYPEGDFAEAFTLLCKWTAESLTEYDPRTNPLGGRARPSGITCRSVSLRRPRRSPPNSDP